MWIRALYVVGQLLFVAMLECATPTLPIPAGSLSPLRSAAPPPSLQVCLDYANCENAYMWVRPETKALVDSHIRAGWSLAPVKGRLPRLLQLNLKPRPAAHTSTLAKTLRGARTTAAAASLLSASRHAGATTRTRHMEEEEEDGTQRGAHERAASRRGVAAALNRARQSRPDAAASRPSPAPKPSRLPRPDAAGPSGPLAPKTLMRLAALAGTNRAAAAAAAEEEEEAVPMEEQPFRAAMRSRRQGSLGALALQSLPAVSSPTLPPPEKDVAGPHPAAKRRSGLGLGPQLPPAEPATLAKRRKTTPLLKQQQQQHAGDNAAAKGSLRMPTPVPDHGSAPSPD